VGKNYIFFIIFSVIVFSGCSTTRIIERAESRIADLERINEEWAARNSELERLIEAERNSNKQLERIINEYVEAERLRVEAERKLAERLSGIFKEGSSVVDKLIKGYQQIEAHFGFTGLLEQDNLDGGIGDDGVGNN
jgi:chromosome segregation ATPase